MSGLPCRNCHKPVAEAEAKVFSAVFVCPTCYEMAERLHGRFEAELKKLLFMSKETIRRALMESRLQYPEGVESGASTREVLEMIVGLSEAKDENGPSRG